ncbi:MAG: phage capsid protein [Erythrobacter sp.]
MPYESEIPQSFRTTYRDSVEFLLQQGDSKLLPCIMDMDGSGELHKITDQLEDVDPMVKTGRNANTEYVEVGHDGRWVAQPNPIYFSTLVDKQDQLASGIDLTGNYAKAGARSIARGTDDIILGAFYGQAQTGLKGTVMKGFDSGNVVPVDQGGTGNTNLTITKLRAAWEILAANFVDLDSEEFWMAVTASQAAALMSELQHNSTDFGATGAEMRDGKLRKLYGFNFVHIELGNPRFKNAGLTVDSNNYRKVPFWAKSGMAAVFWDRLYTSIDRLPGKHYSAQVYASRDVAATRLEEGKCGYILCNEGP